MAHKSSKVSKVQRGKAKAGRKRTATSKVSSNGNGHLLSEVQAADYLGLCRLTIFRLRKQGSLGHYRVGTRVLYDVDRHLRPFLDSREQKPVAALNDKARAASGGA